MLKHDIVKTLARQRGMTFEELAIKSGVKMSTVKNLWQNRTENPSLLTVSAVAKALGVPIEELLEDEETDKRKPGVALAY